MNSVTRHKLVKENLMASAKSAVRPAKKKTSAAKKAGSPRKMPAKKKAATAKKAGPARKAGARKAGPAKKKAGRPRKAA
jgi:hypothetical protein